MEDFFEHLYDHLYAVFGQICWSTGVDWARGGGGAPDLGFRPSADGGEGPETREQGVGRPSNGPRPVSQFFQEEMQKISGRNLNKFKKKFNFFLEGDLKPRSREQRGQTFQFFSSFHFAFIISIQ